MLLSNFDSSVLTLKFFLFLILIAVGATAFLLKCSPQRFKIFESGRRNTHMIHDHVRCREHHSLDALKYILEPTTGNPTSSLSTDSTTPQKSKPKPVPLHTLLYERALPNARLVRALGLTNTFVSFSPDVHRAFVQRAKGMLRGAQGKGLEWVVQVGRGAVRWTMEGEEGVNGCVDDDDGNATAAAENPSLTTVGPQEEEQEEQIITFDSLIQTTTLFIVLVALLDVESPFESDSQSPLWSSSERSDLEIVARNITILWGLSKRPDAIPKHLLEELHGALGRLMQMKKDGDKEFHNPLDFVVPTWETLWRVVATMVAYAYSRGDDSEDMRRALVEFVKDPTEARFRRASNTNMDSSSLINSDSAELGREGEPDVRCFVAESMRLHPPSKRIGRSKPRAWWAWFLQILPTTWVWPRDIGMGIEHLTRVKIQADVGALLRCPKVWGSDAASFVPQRHLSPRVTEEQNEAMGWVFGYGRLRCVAATWAPMAAGVVAGVVVEGIEKGGWEVVRGEGGVGGRGGWEGWVVRR